MKHIFIVNPISGKNKKEKITATIQNICKEKDLEFEILITQYPKHATQLANNYSIKDNVCLYSVGGDGTAYEILNGINDKVCLSIIPSGSGNDCYKMLCDNAPKTLYDQLLEAIEGEVVYVDYGIGNDTRFFNCTTIGLDAQINYRATHEIRNRFLSGHLTYLVAALSKFLKANPTTITIEVNNEKWTQECSLCAVMNGQYYGGGFNPTPNASIDDGMFDICIVDKLSRGKLFQLVSKYLKGTHTDLSVVKMIRANKIVISSDTLIDMQSDGESFKEKHIHLEIMHKGLKLKVPSHSKLLNSENN